MLAFSLALVSSDALAEDGPATDPEIARLQQETARYQAQEAAANARKAAIDAEVAAANAAAGAIPETEYGSIEVGDNAGLAETGLLNAQQLHAVAVLIASNVPVGRNVIVLTDAQQPDLGTYRTYAARRTSIERAYAESIEHFAGLEDQIDAILGRTPRPNETSDMSLVDVGGALTALTRLGSLFRSNVNIQGGDITSDDAFLATSVAGAIRGANAVYLGSSWMGASAYDAVTAELARLDTLRLNAARLEARANQRKALYERAAEASSNEAVKGKYLRVAALFEEAAVRLKAALDAHVEFATWISTAPENGRAPFDAIVQQMALSAQLADNAYVVVVHTHSAARGTMTQENLWTFIGNPPFSVAASAVVTSQVINPRNGAILSAGAYVCDSPYTRMNAIHSRSARGQTLVTCRQLGS